MFSLPCLLTIFATLGEAARLDYKYPAEAFYRQRRVAIVGAGAAGSSAAYHLKHYAEQEDIGIDITVYEKEDRIGGRTQTVNAFNDWHVPVEAGASVFVEVNEILGDAVARYNLSTHPFRWEDQDADQLGIWNGQEFVFTQGASNGWWDLAKLFWKYGIAPYRARNMMKDTVQKFRKMYSKPHFPWRSLSDVVQDVDLTFTTGITGEALLQEHNIGKKFADEIIQAATRVNYAQNLGLIHGVETMVCLATEGAVSVRGGNWQIFDHMIHESADKLLTNSAVESIELPSSERVSFHVKSSGAEPGSNYDAVILAPPYQFSNIKISPTPANEPEEIPYVQLHVTLFTARRRLSPRFFNLPEDKLAPNVILTTLQPNETYGSRPDSGRVGAAGFFSISTLGRSQNPENGAMEYIYKIFSPEAVSTKFLENIFGFNEGDQCAAGFCAHLSWIERKVFNSYPYEYPRVTFGEMVLDKGLYYTSPIEGFISSMETCALAGKNVARLIIDDFVGASEKHRKQDAGSYQNHMEL